MPIQALIQVQPDVELGVWKITESPEELESQLMLSETERNYYHSLRAGSRSLQWLSSRVLLRQMIKATDFIDVRIDRHDKPYLYNFPHHFSISHSHQFAAVMISECCLVGIDIEEIDPKIERIAQKFLSPIEMTFLQPVQRMEQLYACWTAKEALYKLYGKKGVSFKDNILLSPFTYSDNGQVVATLALDEFYKQFTIHYKIHENFMIAWVVD